MDLKLDPAAVERYVAEAVLQSAIGAKVTKAVSEVIGRSWDNPLDKAIEAVVRDVALKIVHTEFHDRIAEAVRQKLTEQTIEDIVSTFWDKLMRDR